MKVSILFGRRNARGSVSLINGRLGSLSSTDGRVSGQSFDLPEGGRLDISCADCRLSPGAFPTICRLETAENPFSFNLRDISAETPVFIPGYDVAIIPGGDTRDYGKVAGEIARLGLVSDFARFEAEPEESYDSAAARNRVQYAPTWLGLGRDMRLFRVGYREEHNWGKSNRYLFWGQVKAFYHTRAQDIAGRGYGLAFAVGQGASCRPEITRRLEDGALPILRATQSEQDMRYHLAAFATLEKRPLAPGAVRGTEWSACYPNTGGNMTSEEEREKAAGLLEKEMRRREEEVVCLVRVEALNTGRVPRFAWFKAPAPQASLTGTHLVPGREQAPLLPDYEFSEGMCRMSPGGPVLAVCRLEGKPMPDEEMAILVQPGQAVTVDFLVPHSPLEAKRARALSELDFESHLEGCRKFWQAHLASSASITVPEKTIDETIRAGLLHCDLAAIGREPGGPVMATIGPYSPIGTESAPIIQFFDSMGRHELAARCLDFFFARQRADGFIQNFANYQSETGPVLWTAGEHFRYTRDADWLRRVFPNIKKAADYLLEWRRRNMTEECRAKGFYGMVDGKVADPHDFYHSFFLNAGTHLGLSRTAEMAREIDPAYAEALTRECEDYRRDIRAGFRHALARSPVVPLPDGSWAPLAPPWVEHTGPIGYYAEGGRWFSHGEFASRSSLTGPVWLVIGEVFEPGEPETDFLLKTNQYPVTLENAALSQPYYCRHDFAHLVRGEVNAFLKTYYNQLTALHDRETYTFLEHYYYVTEHKTHEEAWFLMQTRWMLWLERGEKLYLLRGVPRAWLDGKKPLRIDRVSSYFGPLGLEVEAQPVRNLVTARVTVGPERPPAEIVLRLPHPEKRRAVSCSGGRYDPVAETVTFRPGKKETRVTLKF